MCSIDDCASGNFTDFDEFMADDDGFSVLLVKPADCGDNDKTTTGRTSMIERTRMAFVLAVLCSAMLGACGGGGSGSGDGGGGGGGGTSLSGNANLSALTVTGADLEQAFDPGSTAYTAVVGFLIDSIQVDAPLVRGLYSPETTIRAAHLS